MQLPNNTIMKVDIKTKGTLFIDYDVHEVTAGKANPKPVARRVVEDSKNVDRVHGTLVNIKPFSLMFTEKDDQLFLVFFTPAKKNLARVKVGAEWVDVKVLTLCVVQNDNYDDIDVIVLDPRNNDKPVPPEDLHKPSDAELLKNTTLRRCYSGQFFIVRTDRYGLRGAFMLAGHHSACVSVTMGSPIT